MSKCPPNVGIQTFDQAFAACIPVYEGCVSMLLCISALGVTVLGCRISSNDPWTPPPPADTLVIFIGCDIPPAHLIRDEQSEYISLTKSQSSPSIPSRYSLRRSEL